MMIPPFKEGFKKQPEANARKNECQPMNISGCNLWPFSVICSCLWKDTVLCSALEDKDIWTGTLPL